MPEEERKLVVITGASGFLGSHCVRQALESGYNVRATLRDATNEDKLACVGKAAGENVDRVTFVTLDLQSPHDEWLSALKGANYLIHCASVVKVVIPEKDRQSACVEPAVEGTLNALRAANETPTIERVVVTSSIFAVATAAKAVEEHTFTEEDFLDLSAGHVTPYEESKVRAEQAAWEFMQTEKPSYALTTFCPSYIVGPLYSPASTYSVEILKFLWEPLLPHIQMPAVDVRDLAYCHVTALSMPETANQRYIASAQTYWLANMAELINAAVEKRGINLQKKFTTWTGFNFMVRLAALFDDSVVFVTKYLSRPFNISNEKITKTFDLKMRDPIEALADMVESLVQMDVIPTK